MTRIRHVEQRHGLRPLRDGHQLIAFDPRPDAKPLVREALQLQRAVAAPLELPVLPESFPPPQAGQGGFEGVIEYDDEAADGEDEGQPEDAEGGVCAAYYLLLLGSASLFVP